MTLPEKKDVPIHSWSLTPVERGDLVRAERNQDLNAARGPYVPRGLGRSYGDAALLAGGKNILTERLDRILAFDPETGILRAEAGLSLASVLTYFVPQGWFPPVTPGTKFVTLGGCIAADIHGKNHHVDGSFGRHVREIELVLANGTRARCSPTQDPELFWATVGGMGLTGIISEATIQLRRIDSSYIVSRHLPATDLEQVLNLLNDPDSDDDYSVAWIDCLASGKNLGRSIVILGHHAKNGELTAEQRTDPYPIHAPIRWNFPFIPPLSLINRWTVKAFNNVYYQVHSSVSGSQVVPYDGFMYPLDSVGHWNRVYGRKGFVQYQFVLPTDQAADGLREVLERITQQRTASFLAVIKRFGPQGQGLLSFPKTGYTLALDIPITGQDLFPQLDELDCIVLRRQGRVYLAKDMRLSPESYRVMYPRSYEFDAIKKRLDPDSQVRSDLAKRLGIGGLS